MRNADIIIVEAMADHGTAWYHAAILLNNSIAYSFPIDEPRADSEKSPISDFIGIEYADPKFIFKFKKDLIAGYSSAPAKMEEDECSYIKNITIFKTRTEQMEKQD